MAENRANNRQTTAKQVLQAVCSWHSSPTDGLHQVSMLKNKRSFHVVFHGRESAARSDVEGGLRTFSGRGKWWDPVRPWPKYRPKIGRTQNASMKQCPVWADAGEGSATVSSLTKRQVRLRQVRLSPPTAARTMRRAQCLTSGHELAYGSCPLPAPCPCGHLVDCTASRGGAE